MDMMMKLTDFPKNIKFKVLLLMDLGTHTW